jgi:hypothetical protein
MQPLIRVHHGDLVTRTDPRGTVALDASILGRSAEGPSIVYVPPADEWDALAPEWLRGCHGQVVRELAAVGLRVEEALGAPVRPGDPESTPYRTLP